VEHGGLAILLGLEQSGLGLLIRNAVLIYPIANVVHVVAVLVFFGSVLVMDARLLGALRGEDYEAVVVRWRPVAIAAFVVIVGSGFILFVPEAAAMGRNRSFQIKAVLVLIGLANVLAMGRALRHPGSFGDVPAKARVLAGLSILIWLAVAACGRFIAYA
jgi:hypothetical protein